METSKEDGEFYAAYIRANSPRYPYDADPEVARIQRNMDLFAGLDDDPFAEEG